MSRSRWHILREGDTVTVARRLPVRWDVAVEVTLPNAARLRVAQQVRQDMWRALQDIRGFAPVVSARRDGDQLHIKAGGAVHGPVPRAKMQMVIAEVLHCPKRRARWLRSAQLREVRT